MEDSMIDDSAELRRMFEDAAALTQESRAEAELARDYYNGLQYTDEERTALQRRKQPILTFNRIRRKIDYISGAEQQSRTDPRAYPRNPQDEDAAEAATDALRYVEERTKLDEIFSDAFNEMMVEGFSGLEVLVKDSPRGPEITVEKWAWDRLFYDPHSTKHDFSDAAYFGGVIWMNLDEATTRWGDKAKDLATTMDEAPDTTYEDKPRAVRWYETSNGRARVKVVQIWYRRDGEWHWCIFSNHVKLEGGKSPFVDEDGESMCLMLLQSLYVDRDNKRHGVVRDMFSPQDAINKSRSKSMHLMNMRQTYGTKNAVGDVNKAKRELAKPDGHIEIEGKFGDNFGIIPTSDMASGNLSLLQDAKEEMDLMGPNAAMQGKSGEDASGRAILAQQQGGMVELTPALNRLRSLKLRTYRVIWNLIRQVWTEERWIRVTDDENKAKFVGLNRPVTFAEQAQREAEEAGIQPQELQQMLAIAQQQGQDPNEVMGVENVPADMDMDIIIEEQPDIVTLQMEQFEQLAQLASSGFPISPKTLIRASALKDKERILEEMSGQDDPQAAQAAQQQQEMQMAGAQAEIRKTEADAAKSEAQAYKTIVDANTPPQPPTGQPGA